MGPLSAPLWRELRAKIKLAVITDTNCQIKILLKED
jgi:hypothetical protein